MPLVGDMARKHGRLLPERETVAIRQSWLRSARRFAVFPCVKTVMIGGALHSLRLPISAERLATVIF